MAGRPHHEREIRHLRLVQSVRPEVSKGERDFLRDAQFWPEETRIEVGATGKAWLPPAKDEYLEEVCHRASHWQRDPLQRVLQSV